MPVIISVAAIDGNVTKKGDICSVHSPAWGWGKNDQPPKRIRVTISDSSKSQVLHYLDHWEIKFQHEIKNETVEGYRIELKVDPAVISTSEIGKNQIKTKMVDWFYNNYNAQTVSFSSNSYLVDIPKPVDLVDLKKNFADIFNARFAVRRYHFSEADVDTIIGMGGFITITKAQALNYIKDKLAE